MRRLLTAVLIALFAAPATGFAQTSSNFKLVRAELVPMAAQQTQQAQQAPARRNWIVRHPVLVGTMAGAGVGLVWLANEGCSSSDYTCGGLAAFFGGLGAGLGAGAGAIVGLLTR